MAELPRHEPCTTPRSIFGSSDRFLDGSHFFAPAVTVSPSGGRLAREYERSQAPGGADTMLGYLEGFEDIIPRLLRRAWHYRAHMALLTHATLLDWM